MIVHFFEQLADYSKENNLSDFILYVSNCSETFRNFFIKFIFPEICNLPNLIEIEREYPSTDKTARIDFKFVVNDKIYLIENKIYDINHHYEHYLSSYPGCHIGFIANYDVSKLNIYKNRNCWENFYKSASEILVANISEPIEKKLICAFLSYLKRVCNIMEIRNFEPRLSCDLQYLNSLFNKLITMHSENGLIINNMARGCIDCRNGKYFQFNKEKIIHDYWFGIYTADYSNNIMIEALKRKEDEFEKKDGNYYKQPYYDEDGVWFELKQQYLEKLNNSSIDFEAKHKIIEDFFLEVISYIEPTF
jgi:hypothetical protein